MTPDRIVKPDGVDVKLDATGGANVLEIAEPAVGSMTVSLGGGARVSIGAGAYLSGLFIHACAGASVTIGKNTSFAPFVRLLLHEPRSIVIGDGCLLAGPTDITVSDMHAIIDVSSRRRVNMGADVEIGARVWIATGCLILKGAKIGAGSIIGARSVVTRRPIPPNCIAAGTPASVVRTGVTWDHSLNPSI